MSVKRTWGTRICTGVLTLVLLAACLSPSAAVSRDGKVPLSVKCRALAHPVLKYPYLFAIGKFQCASGAKSAKATLVFQGFEHGTWNTIESVTRKVDARPGKKYVLRTKRLHCSTTPHKLKVRTEFELDAAPLRLQLPPSEAFPTYCI